MHPNMLRTKGSCSASLGVAQLVKTHFGRATPSPFPKNMPDVWAPKVTDDGEFCTWCSFPMTAHFAIPPVAQTGHMATAAAPLATIQILLSSHPLTFLPPSRANRQWIPF